VSCSTPLSPAPLAPHLFPYTTLFRSGPANHIASAPKIAASATRSRTESRKAPQLLCRPDRRAMMPSTLSAKTNAVITNVPHRNRSEEHTSELQSRENLVCRLLLEKKK